MEAWAIALCVVAGVVLCCAVACVAQCRRVKSQGGAKTQEGGAGTRTPLAPVSPETYPFYAMRVKDLMELTEWLPHQKLLAAGKLINLGADPTAAKGREVIFVSHQWTAFDHPDPACSQLQALQRVLRKLLTGGLEVRTNGMLEAIYGIKVITPGTAWQAMLPEALIWIDYACMPQPSVEDDPAEQASDGAQVQDHRLLANASEAKQRVIEQLTAAVDSIPSYVERCSQMWVLVPATEHKDLPETTCDLYSWRSRGWCRMEFAASKLARGDDMPIVVIESSTMLYYLNPCDTVRLCAADGDFSVPNDVAKVNTVLGKMHQAKVDYYIEQGEYGLARALIIFRPNFAPVGSTSAIEDITIDVIPQAGVGALANLKKRIRWRDEATEAVWMAETGWSLLALAAALDDLAAVNYLLAQPNAAKLLKQHIKAHKKDTPLKSQPFGYHIGTSFDHLDPLTCAATWATPPVVQALLDAGAKVTMDAACGHLPCHCTGAVMGDKIDNLAVMIKHDPTLATKVRDDNRFTALHFACERSGKRAKDIVQLLLDSGATGVVNNHNVSGETPLYTLCKKAEVLSKDPTVLSVLTGAGADINAELEHLNGSFSAIRPVAKLMSDLGVQQMEGFTNYFNELEQRHGQTVLQKSAAIGHSRQMKVLMSGGAAVRDSDPVVASLKTTHGDTAAPALVEEALRSKASGSASTQP